MASDLGCLGDACGPNGTGGSDSSISLHTPFFGGTNTSSYHILLLLHILCVIVAFGPTLVFPMINRLARQNEGPTGSRIAFLPYLLNKMVFLPGVIGALIFGILLTADSKPKGGNAQYSMSQGWVSGALALVIALALVSWFLLRPAQKRLMDGLAIGETGRETVRKARGSISAATGLFHLGLIIIIILMIWKPGS